jgi:hypothetical protein
MQVLVRGLAGGGQRIRGSCLAEWIIVNTARTYSPFPERSLKVQYVVQIAALGPKNGPFDGRYKGQSHGIKF